MGLIYADGIRTLFVESGEGVRVQVDIAETEKGIQVVPVELVCSHFVGNGILHRAVCVLGSSFSIIACKTEHVVSQLYFVHR